ncbi:MAG TPA: tRNA 2-thiouridine(34) synthase MnmA [bacterium]|nr:tRNA 2-thiouridine(34) synthase MnmA [bacterium]HPT29654.1 tRNA 2-thiouridine(34) synthase MnmA [bacterium]
MSLKENAKKRVLMALSGGVDSAVAAALLKAQGYQVTGVFLHFWHDAGQVGENKCCSLKAMQDAKEVADQVGIPLFSFDYSRQFKLKVVGDFLHEYKCGRTPNPCVVCNREVKIGRLLKYAQGLNFDYVATGHYVKNKKIGKKYHLSRGQDKNKDQSYFLYTFHQDQLAHLLFPLGGYTKPQVRVLAKKLKLPVAEKAESQEICFIPEKHHNDFLKRNLKLKPGKIKLLDGTVIGEHQGLPLYTIGQRRGIEIGGNGPYYVAKFDTKKQDLYVVKKFDDPILYGKELLAKKVTWIDKEIKTGSLSAVIRYRHPAEKVKIKKLPDGNYRVVFSRPQRAITSGQSVVFYRGQEVLGGGIIN